METFWHDLRFTVRTCAKQPGFTAVAVLTLALGIGASTAIFSMIDAVLIDPLPYGDPEGLMAIFGRAVPMSPESFQHLRDANTTGAGMAALDMMDFNLVDEQGPVRATGAMVTANFFELFGVRPVVGRAFSLEEGEPGKNNVALISHELWQSRFAGQSDIVGRELRLYSTAFHGPEREIGHAITVIGVLPEDFVSPRWPRDVWVPLTLAGNEAQRRGRVLNPYIRLNPGTAPETAEAELQQLHFAASDDQTVRAAEQIQVVPLIEVATRNVRPALLAVTVAVAFVLLIGCVNVAYLLLARASIREREIAVRMSLGAPRRRLVRQFLVESLVLAFLGSVCGLAVARGLIFVLEAWQANATPRLPEITIHGTALLFTVGLSCLTALLFGLVPALRATQPSFSVALRDGSGGALGARSRLRQGLVIAEVTLAVVLLVGAGLLIKSFQRLMDVEMGFESQGVLAFGVALPQLKYGEAASRQTFFRQAVEDLQALPEVESAAAINILPFSYTGMALGFDIEGSPLADGEASRWAHYRVASADLFQTLEVQLLAGEIFRQRDVQAEPSVVVVSRSMAERYWGEDFRGKNSPIGSSITLKNFAQPLRVIGVVGDIRTHARGEPTAMMYVPSLTTPVMSFVLRGRGQPEALTEAARRVVSAIDVEQPIHDARTLDHMALSQLSRPRYNAFLVALFAGLALVLSAVGIYGVLSFSVSRRTREMGLRLAIGAQRWDVLRLVIGQGMRLVLVGLAFGLAASLGLSRFLESLLFGVTATDPSIFVAISGVLVAVALMAVCVPALRATRVEPVTALRHE